QGQPSYGAFGPGWNTSFEVRLVGVSSRFTTARNSDGNPQYYFDNNGSGVLRSIVPSSADSWITSASCDGAHLPGYSPGTGYCWKRYFRAGGAEFYWSGGTSDRGFILSSTDASGVVTTYTYGIAGFRLLSVSRLGRSIVLTYEDEFSRKPLELRDG